MAVSEPGSGSVFYALVVTPFLCTQATLLAARATLSRTKLYIEWWLCENENNFFKSMNKFVSKMHKNIVQLGVPVSVFWSKDKHLSVGNV